MAAFTVGAGPTGATHGGGCSPGVEPATDYTPLGNFYVRVWPLPPTAPVTPPVWYIYEETNSVPGLQRDDIYVTHDHCGHGPDLPHLVI